MNILKYNYFLYSGLILAFVVCSFFRIEQYKARTTLHIDEIASIVLANCTPYFHEVYEDDSQMRLGQEWKSIFYSDENSVSEIWKDLTSLWHDTTDQPHSNFYYSLLRISFYGADTTDYHQIYFRAFALNMILFLISFVFMVKLCRLFTKDNLVTISTIFTIFLLQGTIYSTFNYRPYPLQEAMFCVLTYFYIKYLFQFHYRDQNLSIGKTLLVGLLSALTLLTGYFSIPYVLMLWFLLTVFFCLRKSYSNTLNSFLSLFFCAVFTSLFYPRYFINGATSNRANGALNNLDSLSSLKEELISPLFHQFNFYFIGIDKIIIILFFAIAGILFSRFYLKKIKIGFKLYVLLALCLISLIWIEVVILLAPWKGAHYYRAVLPVFALGLLLPLYYSKLKIYYVFAFLLPLFFVWVSTVMDIDLFSEQKGTTPMVFAGRDVIHNEDSQIQFAYHEFFNDGRLVGFSFDRENLEKKLNELDQETIVALRLDFSYKIFTEEEYLKHELFLNYIDTAKYKINKVEFSNAFLNLFYVEKKQKALVNAIAIMMLENRLIFSLLLYKKKHCLLNNV